MVLNCPRGTANTAKSASHTHKSPPAKPKSTTLHAPENADFNGRGKGPTLSPSPPEPDNKDEACWACQDPPFFEQSPKETPQRAKSLRRSHSQKAVLQRGWRQAAGAWHRPAQWSRDERRTQVVWVLPRGLERRRRSQKRKKEQDWEQATQERQERHRKNQKRFEFETNQKRYWRGEEDWEEGHSNGRIRGDRREGTRRGRQGRGRRTRPPTQTFREGTAGRYSLQEVGKTKGLQWSWSSGK